jgi:hypothetical protein
MVLADDASRCAVAEARKGPADVAALLFCLQLRRRHRPQPSTWMEQVTGEEYLAGPAPVGAHGLIPTAFVSDSSYRRLPLAVEL